MVGNNSVTITYVENGITLSGTTTIVGTAKPIVNLFNKNDSNVQLGVRWSSSSKAFTSGTTNLATGFIDAKIGDSFTLTSDTAQNVNSYGGYMIVYNSSKEFLGVYSKDAIAKNGWTWASDYLSGNVTISSTYGDGATGYESAAYVRFCVAYTNIDSIVITKN